MLHFLLDAAIEDVSVTLKLNVAASPEACPHLYPLFFNGERNPVGQLEINVDTASTRVSRYDSKENRAVSDHDIRVAAE